MSDVEDYTGRTGRNETREEQLDRNWAELLQELRVLQTGVQILAGFLLTLPFQERFEDLDSFQVNLYLANVVIAALTTAFILQPVSAPPAFPEAAQGDAGLLRGHHHEDCAGRHRTAECRHRRPGL